MLGHAEECAGCGAAMTATQIWCGSCGNQRDLEILDLEWDDGRAVIIDRQETVLPFWWPWFLPAVAVVVAVVGIGGPLIFPDEMVTTEEEPAAAPEPVPPIVPTTATTTTVVVEPATPTISPPGPAGPLLGVPTGLRLLSVGGGTSTRIVDLDTAAVEHFDFRGSPNGATPPLLVDGQVIAAGLDAMTIRVVPLDDLDAEPLSIGVFEAPRESVLIAASEVVGHLWVLGSSWDDRGRIIELADVNLEAGSATPVFSSVLDWWVEPALGERGLVVATPEGPRLIGRSGISDWPHGQPLAFGPNIAVALVCDDGLVCSPSLVELATGRRIPLDLGTGPSGYTEGGSFSADVSLYASFNWRTAKMQVFDVATGEVVAGFGPRPGETDPGRPAWSPGGDLVAWRSSDGVLVGDVATGAIHQLPVDVVGHAYDSRSASLVFLE